MSERGAASGSAGTADAPIAINETVVVVPHVLPSADVETAHTFARHILGDGTS